MVLDFLFTKKEAKVLFIGDSITQGTEWKILLSRLDVKNIAEGGYTTSHLIAESYLQKIEDSNAEVFLFPPAIKI